MTSQAEVSQRSESKISSSLGSSHALRALLATDSVPTFQRWRQVTALDHKPESACYLLKPGIVPNSKMCTSPVRGLVESVPGRDSKARLAGSGYLKDSGGGHHTNCYKRGSPGLILKRNQAKIVSNLRPHALRALMEADDVQKLKRRRMTTLGNLVPVKISNEYLDGTPRVLVSRQPNGLSLAKETACSEESLPSSDSGGLLRTSALRGIAQSFADNAGSGDCILNGASSEVIKGKGDNNSDSSGHLNFQGTENLDKSIAFPSRHSGGSPDAFSLKKKQWLGQHHGDNEGEISREHVKYFAGIIGVSYRSAIDNRPAAPHPGFVGDGGNVQFCRVCGEREDATSSLICDSCEQVCHVGCLNVRTKIIPQVDEWLCRPCKRKGKMVRECANQGDSNPVSEPKCWWREDSRIGLVERELLRMSNGRRVKVRLGLKFQADVPEWTGLVDEVDLHDNLAETSYRFGEEIALTREDKLLEQETAEYNLANNVRPKGWPPATNSEGNWIQCTLVLFEKGEMCPDGSTAEKAIVCGKWRRAPVGMVPDHQWECSCALVWDPRYADCAVPQELSSKEIEERMKKSLKLIL